MALKRKFFAPYTLIRFSYEAHDELIDSKVCTPDRGVGIVSQVELGHPDMLVIDFNNGNIPYFKKQLTLAEDHVEMSDRPDTVAERELEKVF